MRIKSYSQALLCNSAGLIASLVFLSSCGPANFTAAPTATTAIASYPEASNCIPVTPVTNPITISGDAIYYYRPTNTTLGLSGNPVSADIRYAEVAIYTSGGTLIQCGETDGNGDFSLQITKTVGSYWVQINSRSAANSTKINASVLEDIYSNTPYAITKNFSITAGSVAISTGTLEAYARISESAKIEGAAFFILDNILVANDRIRTLADPTFVASKVQMYWKAGFNPYAYFGFPNTLSSFYINGERKVYMLGGKNGDVKNIDTDHFDASVILHEYGHFLEDVYGKSESPGGSHNADSVSDPRLVWSEGWGNYIQAEFLNGRYFSKSLYIDTVGFKNDTVEGSYAGTGIGIKFDLSTDGATSLYDPVSLNGEGTFRELSVARTLYKTTKSPASNVSGSRGSAVPFSAIWNTFKSVASGFGTNASIIFRSVGYLNEFLSTYITANHAANLADWQNNVLADEKQNASRLDYASPVSTAGVCAKYPKSLIPIVDEDYNGQYYKSNHLRSNDFYTFYYTGLGTQTITLTYTQGGAQTVDLDLIILKSNYKIVEDEQEYFQGYSNPYYAVRSRRLNPSVETGSEVVSLSGLSSGFYLINIKAVTFNRNTGLALSGAQLNGTANYSLSLTTNSTTEFLCPAH